MQNAVPPSGAQGSLLYAVPRSLHRRIDVASGLHFSLPGVQREFVTQAPLSQLVEQLVS
jgi:hypothetical protein